MRKNDIINKTTKRLEEAAEIRKGNITFQRGNDLIENIHIEDREFEFKRLIKAISGLKQQEQKLIAYRYFENKTYRQIGYLMNIGHSTAPRWVNNAILNLGRALYGMEKEFWDQFK